MISKEQFQTFCLPSLARQARIAGRCVVHVDGPGASKHAEALAANPDISALQYTCGAGTPSALAKLDMFKLIQSYRKPIVVNCPLEEVPQLVEKLDHRGLAIRPEWVPDMNAAAELLKVVGA
ncbi:MAG: hypothetical protein EHM48_07775 [Planctomycetaceae bacterium]|nr:MAG: hypothetical protein EHM48_07775 [Planctomycetaceae bacterium]